MYMFKKGLDRINFQKGEWFELMDGAKRKAYVCCPLCEELLGIWNHIILDDGRVVPSVVCGVKGCKFHEFIKLEGWND